MELYAARHGETEFNKQRLWQGGGIDSPLTALGEEQARMMGDKLKGEAFDAVYSSPLKRAMDTARIAFDNPLLFNGNGMGVTDARLREIEIGELEGTGYINAESRFEENARAMFNDTASYVPPRGGESIPDVMERVDLFLRDLIDKPHKRVFVQTHGYILRVVYACSRGKSLDALNSAPFYENCALLKFVYNDDKKCFEQM